MFLSVFDIFKIGVGPSSSHTMGPMTAAARFLDDLRGAAEKIPGAGTLTRLGASLHGSLAFTGKGHATDRLKPRSAAQNVSAHLGLARSNSIPKVILYSTMARPCLAMPTDWYSGPLTNAAILT